MEDLEHNETEQCDSPLHSQAGSPPIVTLDRDQSHQRISKIFPAFVVLTTLANWIFYFYGVVYLIDHANVTLSAPISPPISSWYFYTVTDYPNCEDARESIIRSFMYQFVHSGMMHLCGNTIAALTYGVIFNMYSGSGLLVVGIVYEASIYLGGLGHSLVWPYKGLIGCSPGVYGLIGGCWVLWLFNRRRLDGIVAFILPFVLFAQLLGDVFSYLVMFSSSIGYASHFFGFCTGVTLSLTCLLWSSKRDELFRKCCGAVGFSAFVLLAYFLMSHSQQTWPPKAFERPFLNNTNFPSCCAQLLSYAQESEQSVDSARAETYCYNDELYQK